MTFKHSTSTPPGAYPVVHQRRKAVESKSIATTGNNTTHLGFKSTVGRLKSYFQHNKEVQVVQSHSKWKNIWSRKKQQKVIQHSSTSNTVAIGTVFSLSVPITISTHYHSEQETMIKPTKAHSLVQQLVILPPLQVYGFLFLATLFLLVVAFALLEIHRTISIIELAVEGIKYVLVSSTTNFLSFIRRIIAWGKI